MRKVEGQTSQAERKLRVKENHEKLEKLKYSHYGWKTEREVHDNGEEARGVSLGGVDCPLSLSSFLIAVIRISPLPFSNGSRLVQSKVAICVFFFKLVL